MKIPPGDNPLHRGIVALLFVTTFNVSSIAGDHPRGYLVAIGGGEVSSSLVERIVGLAGGPNGKLLIVPVASSNQLESAQYHAAEFRSHGAAEVGFALFTRESADDDTTRSKFAGVTCVFFSGGDQSRITEALLGTSLLKRIKEIYESGGVIAGTSAGAAALSRVMITGNELRNTDAERPFRSIRKGNIETTEGLGFLVDAIVDQHFVARRRHNRLISLVLEHPDLLGIGIDESTAIIFKPDGTFDVEGENTVVIYDAVKATHAAVDEKGNLAATSIAMHVLRSGQRFDRGTRLPGVP